MYKVLGADGKVYGPVSLEQLGQWAAQGRLNPQSQVQPEGATQWQAAGAIPEVSAALAAAGYGAPPAMAAPSPLDTRGAGPSSGLAITSFVLGLVSLPFSFFCVGLLTGLAAVICGHVAHARARRAPAQHGGAGFAVAGFVLGYVSVIVGALMVAALVPALGHAKERAQRSACRNNLMQIGLAFKTWSLDNSNQFPFQVSTNAGGTMELCARGPDGFDKNAAVHFQAMAEELGTPQVLVCPGDTSRSAASSFVTLLPANVSYQLATGPEVNDTNPGVILAVCPVHGTILLVDGSVQWSHRNVPARPPLVVTNRAGR